MIQLAMLCDKSFTQAVDVLFGKESHLHTVKCDRCGLPPELCADWFYRLNPKRSHKYCVYFAKEIAELGRKADLWLEAQSEVDPVGKVLSE